MYNIGYSQKDISAEDRCTNILRNKDKQDNYLYVKFNFNNCNLHADDYFNSLEQGKNTIFRIISLKKDKLFLSNYFNNSDYFKNNKIEIFDEEIFQENGIIFSTPCLFKFVRRNLKVLFGNIYKETKQDSQFILLDSIENKSLVNNPETRINNGFVSYYCDLKNILYWKLPGKEKIDSIHLATHFSSLLDKFYNETIKDTKKLNSITFLRQQLKTKGINEFYFMPYLFQLANGNQSGIVQLKQYDLISDTVITNNEVVFFNINLLNKIITFKPFNIPEYLNNYFISCLNTNNSKDYTVALAPKEKDKLIIQDDTLALCYGQFRYDSENPSINLIIPKPFININTFNKITNNGNTVLLFFRLSDSLIVTPYSNQVFNIYSHDRKDTLPFSYGPSDFSIWHISKGINYYFLSADYQNNELIISVSNNFRNYKNIKIPYELIKYNILGIQPENQLILSNNKKEYIYIYSYNFRK